MGSVFLHHQNATTNITHSICADKISKENLSTPCDAHGGEGERNESALDALAKRSAEREKKDVKIFPPIISRWKNIHKTKILF